MIDIDNIDKTLYASITPVGSRVTCNPPPMNTDCDWLVLANEALYQDLIFELQDQGWELGGSDIPDESLDTIEEDRFHSFTKGIHNLIVTRSPVFHRRFMAASDVAKLLNLQNKSDRIALFQAVLYGNGAPTPVPDDVLEEAFA